MAHELSIGFVGNPNCGKTTLFNAYTGANLKVANWPGVTVEKKEGLFQFHDHEYKLVDLPGTYSLTSYTMEEQVTRQYILSDDVDVIIDVADASALERNLYLTLQLIELGKPVILALNMMDIVQKRGMEIDLHPPAGDAGHPGDTRLRPAENRPGHFDARGGPPQGPEGHRGHQPPPHRADTPPPRPSRGVRDGVQR